MWFSTFITPGADHAGRTVCWHSSYSFLKIAFASEPDIARLRLRILRFASMDL
jgi:hypothetical protein